MHAGNRTQRTSHGPVREWEVAMWARPRPVTKVHDRRRRARRRDPLAMFRRPWSVTLTHSVRSSERRKLRGDQNTSSPVSVMYLDGRTAIESHR